nr:transcription elongation factor GreA [Clostridioides mangenotii]
MMIDVKETLLTEEGYHKLEDELEYLKVTKRKEVAERIKVAISFGDLSENAEYDEAKNEQAQLEERIVKLENMLRKAVIIDESNIDLSVVTIGSIIKLKDLEFDEDIEYAIVGSAEADPYDGKISNESPVGQALLGRSVGETVEVQVPDGVIKFEILDIKR